MIHIVYDIYFALNSNALLEHHGKDGNRGHLVFL